MRVTPMTRRSRPSHIAGRHTPGRQPTGHLGAARRTPTARITPTRPAPRRAPARKLGIVHAAANPRRRLTVMLMVMVVALVAITAKLVDIQVVSRDRFGALARQQTVRSIVLPATRGSIFDRSGRDLAISVPRPTIYADPSRLQDPKRRERVARKLAPVLNIPVADLSAKLTKPKADQFEYLALQVSARLARKVAQLRLPGIGIVADSKRIMPAGSLAAPVIGTAGAWDNGVSGIEIQYDNILKGSAGSLAYERDPSGREIPAADRHEVAAKRGTDLVLTVDGSLQYLVERQLTAAVGKVKARGGMAAIVDVKTGDVLAMANVVGPTEAVPAHPAPPGSPNQLVTDAYEPGSTAKVATIASALETGKINLDTRFSVPASITVGGKQFPDDEAHGTADWTPREILAQSSNVGTIKIADAAGRIELDRTMRQFGFGARTALRFPGEQFGTMQPPTTADPSIMGSMPIGYGITTTAMQTLGVFTTVANGGMSRPPRLVAATIDANGVRHESSPSRTSPPRRVISAKTAADLNELLRGVVATGTGVRAAVPGYTVAGKTGTARKAPYTPPYRYVASFGGFAPAEAPRLAAVVVLDEPKDDVYGGAVAAPVFSTIMQAALRLLHVAPTTPVGDDAGRSNQVTRPEAGSVASPVR